MCIRDRNGTELLYALEHVYELDSEYQNYCRKNRFRKFLIAGMFAAGAAMSAGGFLLMGQENTTAYNRSIEKAQSLIEAGEFEAADDLIQNARLRLPEDIHSYKEELLCLFSMGEYEKAVSCLLYTSYTEIIPGCFANSFLLLSGHSLCWISGCCIGTVFDLHENKSISVPVSYTHLSTC